MTNLQKFREDPVAYLLRQSHDLSERLWCGWTTFVTRCSARMRGVQIGRGLRSWGVTRWQRMPGATICIGSNCAIRNTRRSNNIGLLAPTLITANTRGARVEIGQRVGMSAVTIAAFERVTIGDDCMLGANVLITDSDWHATDPAERLANAPGRTAPVTIGRNVFVGTRAVILKGTTIGDNTVIGAGSVVSGPIPANVVAAGNPCRVIKNLN